MSTFEQYWQRVRAGINRTFGHDPRLRSQLARLEEQCLHLASDARTLDGKLEKGRAEEARHRSELLRRIDGLDRTCKEYDISRNEAGTRLSACEQRIAGLDTGCNQDREALAALQASVAESTQRLEARNQQIKFLQDSAREQLQAFKTELAETRSRLETRDNETNHRLDEEHRLRVSLESSLAEMLGRIEAVDREITALHQDASEQRLQIESFLDSATAQLEVANNRATLLEQRVQTDIELKEKQLQQLQLQLQQLERRFVISVIGAGVALVLLVTLVVLR